ncbi:MAG: diguanylate cyclase [Aquabacterium sp.]
MSSLIAAPMPPTSLPLSARDAERARVAEAGVLLEKTLSWMRFPHELEERFLQDTAARRFRHFMISGWLALIVFNGFLLVDWLMARDVIWLAVQVRLFVFTPLSLIVLGTGTFAQRWALQHLSVTTRESIVLLSGIGAAASLAYILAASKSPMSQYYHVGLMVVIVYGNMVQRLRFWYAVVFSLAVYAIHIGGIMMVTAFNPRLILPMVALIGATVIFTLMTNYAMERDERRHYLLSLRRKLVMEDLGDVRERLQRLTRVDGLTGVYNRRHLDLYLRQVWQRAQHERGHVSIIMVDVDHFKDYNDRYGHLMGDHCLIQVAMTMQESLRRPGDVVARFGGEEFVAVLPNANADEAMVVAERLRQAVERLGLPHQASRVSRCVTVSVGLAHAQARPNQEPASLLSLADEALYEAKRAGRNRVVCKDEIGAEA